MMMMILMMILMMMTMLRAAVHLRTTSLLVMDSRCRGGIAHSGFGLSGVHSVRPESPKALWRFRVSTANSLSGRTWPQTDTPIRYIDHTYAQKDI